MEGFKSYLLNHRGAENTEKREIIELARTTSLFKAAFINAECDNVYTKS
jgi:hypothetical protein